MIYTKERRSLDVNSKSDINDLSSIYAEKTDFNSNSNSINLYNNNNQKRRNSVSSVSPISKETQPNFFSHTTSLSQTKKYDYSAKMDRMNDNKSSQQIPYVCKDNLSFNQLNRYSNQAQTVNNFLKENEKNHAYRLNNTYDRENSQSKIPKYQNKHQKIDCQYQMHAPNKRVKSIMQKQNLSFDVYKQVFSNYRPNHSEGMHYNYLQEEKRSNYRQSKFHAKKSKYSQQVMRKKDNWISKYDQSKQNQEDQTTKSQTKSNVKQNTQDILNARNTFSEIIQSQNIMERIQRVQKLKQQVRQKLLKMKSSTYRTVK